MRRVISRDTAGIAASALSEKGVVTSTHPLENPVHVPSPVYWRNATRHLFLLASVTLLLGMPLFLPNMRGLPEPFVLSVFGAIIFTLIAGLLQPKDRLVTLAQITVSALAVIVFEYHAVNDYARNSPRITLFFIMSLYLAVISLLVMYFGLKMLHTASEVRGRPHVPA